MRVIPHQINRLANDDDYDDDDVIHTGVVDSCAAPQNSSLRLSYAQQRDDQCTRFAPDDSWIDVKNELDSEPIVRVIPHKIEQIERPTRQQHEPKECIIANALAGSRKGPQGKPDSLSVKDRRSRLKTDGYDRSTGPTADRGSFQL